MLLIKNFYYLLSGGARGTATSVERGQASPQCRQLKKKDGIY